MDYFRRSEDDPLRDDEAGRIAGDRHVHYGNDETKGTVPLPKDTTYRREPLRKSTGSYQEDINGEHPNGDAAQHLQRKGVTSQPKRSMTLPDERLMFPQDGSRKSDITGLGIGIQPQSMRIIKGSPKVSESSASSDDGASVPRPQPSLGSNLSFRQKRAQSSATAGPSKYPGMLHISDAGISPKSTPRRRMTSSPDSTQMGNRSPLLRSSSPGRIPVPSSLRPPPVASTSRLQALVGDSVRTGRARGFSQSGLSVPSADGRLARRRRTSPGIATTPIDGGAHPFVASPVSSTFEGDGSGATTPTSIHPASGPKRNSSLSYRVPLERSGSTSQADKDSPSSAREANDDDSMNEERADVADTVTRKRKQSVDPSHAPRRRLVSAEGADNVPETEDARNGKANHGTVNGNGKHRAPLVDLGFETSLGIPSVEESHPALSTANATLDNLLSSIDIANAMRLIQKQTVLPAGVTDDIPGSARSTVRVSPRKQANKPSEVYVPRAPPSILHASDGPEHRPGSSERRLSHGHVAFVPLPGEMSSAEDARSVGSHSEALGRRRSRLSVSSSGASGFLGSKRYVSSSSLNSTNNVNGVSSSNPPFAVATASPEAKHKRSISERFSLSHHLISHGRTNKNKEVAAQPETVDEAALEAKDMASFQERIQSSLLELSHHPRSEKLAYQARSHMQAYYSNVFESIRSAAYDTDPLPANPLAVIRWRKEVHREDAKRKAYEAARTSKRRLSPGQADLASKENSVLNLNSPPNISPHVTRPPSKPLHSAEMLNRAEEADAEKHLKRSAALREWVVTPSEMAAYINCRGIVDRFMVPAPHNGTSLWGDMPQMDRSPSTISASSTRSRSVVSPSSRMGFTKSSMANVSRLSAGTDWASDAEKRSGSVDHSERLSSAIKSPLRSIRRHIHSHHERDPEGRGSMTSDTENEAGKARRHLLLTTAQRFKIRAQMSKEDIQQIENMPSASRESMTASEGKGTEHSGALVDPESITSQNAPRPETLQASRSPPPLRSDKFDVLPTEEDDETYKKRLRALHSVEAALSRTPDMERQSETVVDDFISMVDELRIKGRFQGVQDDLERAKRLRSAYQQRHQIHPDHSGAVVPTSTSALVKSSKSGRRAERNGTTAEATSFDPLEALKGIISDLYRRYDEAVRQAMEVCRKQDNVQRKASEILPDAEHLLSEVGDRVRKLRAIRESFYTLDAIQSSHNPAYYRVVDVGLMGVGLVVRSILLLVRWGIKALGFFVNIGSWIGTFLRTGIVNMGSTVTSLAFWIALFGGIWIGVFWAQRA